MSGLKEKILRLIRAQGPLTVAQFMQIALTDPDGGYYMTRDPFGGDFITAPEVSQMFGELIGAFFVQAWEDRERPEKFFLAELGPGRGTLMADLLRAATIRPDFICAAEVILIEASPVLRSIQARTLRNRQIRWVNDLQSVGKEAPLFLIANEFFDALPVRQFIRLNGRWHERMITVDKHALKFAADPDSSPDSMVPGSLRDAPDGSVFETSPAAQALAREIGRRVAKNNGVALIVDYGHIASGLGDSFQAVKAHRHADPLAEPGEADLTAHVDLAVLAEVARKEGAHISGPVTQGSFLRTLGIEQRATRLKAAVPEETAALDAAIDRLTGKEQMGTLFKVMAITAPDSSPPPGFQC